MALSVMGPSVIPITGITPSFVIYDPADANANHTKFIVSTGGATHVPVLMVGDPSIYNVDLGWFDGITQPTFVVADDDADSYVGFGYSADDTAVVRMLLNSGTLRQHVIPDVTSSTFSVLGAAQTWTGLQTFKNITDGASVQVTIFEGDRATMADGDAAYLTFRLSDDGGNQDEQARLTWAATTVANGATQDGDLFLSALVNGSLTEFLRLDGSASQVAFTQAAVPVSDNGAALGTATLEWADLFLASGGVINWNNGDTVTHSATTLTLAGIATLIAPASLDLFNTATTTLNFAGAATTIGFGASGAAITVGTDFVATHATKALTLTNSGTTQTMLTLSDSTLTTGVLLALASTSTARTAATHNLATITSSGANGTASAITQGMTVSVTNTGTTNTNTALVLTASGGSTANNALSVTAGALIGPATLTLFNTASTTVNAFGAATTMAFGAAASATTWTGQSLTLTGANSTNNTTLTVTNTSNAAAASHAIMAITVGGTTSTGDPQVQFTVTGGSSWTMGADNSASDSFTLSLGTALGTQNVVLVDTRTTVTTGPSRVTLSNLASSLSDAGAAFSALNVASVTHTITDMVTKTTLQRQILVGAVTFNQSGGAVTVDKYAGITSTGAVAGASVSITHSSAFRAMNSGAAVNVSGFYAEAQTAGTTGNYQALFAVSTGASPALIDHVGVNAKDFGVGDTRLYFQAESGGYIALGGNNLYFEQAATIATAATTLTLTPTTDVHITDGHGLVVGHTAQLTVGGTLSEAQVLGTTTGTDSSLLIGLASATDAADAGIKFLKSGDAALGSFTTVATGEYLGSLTWYADDGADYATVAARQQVVANGTIAASRIPSDMVFQLDPGGADDAIREAMRLKGNLSLVLGTGEAGTVAATGGTYRVPDVATGGLGNIDGADLTLTAGLGTGTGDVGTIIFSLPVVAGAGDNPQTRATRLTLDMIGSSTELTMSAPQALAISAISATDSAFRLTDGTSALMDVDTRIAVTNQTFVFGAPASLTLPDGATSRYRLLSTAATSVSLDGTTTVTAISSALDVTALTIAQSGGAVTVNAAAGITSIGATAGASVTLTHSSAFRALTGGASANASGAYFEAQTAGTVGNYQILMANGGTEPVSLADHVGISAVDIGGADATLAIATEVAVAVDADETKFSNKLAVRINGATYYIMLTAT